MDAFRLDGRVAVVTGGGGGLGEGICTALAAAGASVAVAGRTREKLDRVVGQVTAAGGRAVAVEVDIADAGSVAAMTERVVAELDGIDILVNNAAVYHRKPWTEITEADWHHVLDTNLKGYFLCARATYPHLKERGHGRIVNVSSSTAHATAAMTGWYQGCTHALSAVTDALRREVTGDGVDVILIEPGGLDTGIWDKAEDDLLRRRRSSVSPRGSATRRCCDG